MVFIITLFSCIEVYCDAYLADSNIYYGADSYEIDYENEVITATGHAYFRKGTKVLKANRIVIYYAKDESKAEAYGAVRLYDKSDGASVSSSYGEAFFKDSIYVLKGSVKYRKEDIRISSDNLKAYSEMDGNNVYDFYKNCSFENNEYVITSETLRITTDRASFVGRVKVKSKVKTEVIYGKRLEYDLQSGDTIVTGDVVYENGENEILLTAGYIHIFRNEEKIYSTNGVFIVSKDYNILADTMIYKENKAVFDSRGDVVISNDKTIVYCDRFIYYMKKKDSKFLFGVRGEIEQEAAK